MATFAGMAGMMKNMKPEDIVTIISLIQSGRLHLQENDITVQDSVTLAATAPAAATATAAVTASAVAPANLQQQVAPQFDVASSGHVTQLLGSDVGTLQHMVTNPAVDMRSQSFGQMGSNESAQQQLQLGEMPVQGIEGTLQHMVTNPAVDIRSQSFGQMGSNESAQQQLQLGVMPVQGIEGTEFVSAMQPPLPDLAQLRQQIALEKSDKSTIQLLAQFGRQLRARDSQSLKSGESSGIKAQMLESSNQAGLFSVAGGTGPPLTSMIPSGIDYGQVLSQSGSIQPSPNVTTMSQNPHSIPGLDATIVQQMQQNQVQHQAILEQYQQRQQQQSLMQQQLGMATQDVSQSELGEAGGFGTAALMHNSQLQTQQQSLVPGRVAQDFSQSQVGVAGSIGSMPSEVAAGSGFQLPQSASQDASIQALTQQPQLTQGYPLHSSGVVQASEINSQAGQFGWVGNAAPSLVQTPMVQTQLYQGGALNQQDQFGGHPQQEQAAQLNDISLLAQTTNQLNLLAQIRARTARLETQQHQQTIGDIPYSRESVGYGSSTPLIQTRQSVGNVSMTMHQALGSTLVVDPESRKRKRQDDLSSLKKETPGESGQQRRINSGGKKKLAEKCYWCKSDKHVSLDCPLLAAGAKKKDGKTTSASATSNRKQKSSSENKKATPSQSEKKKAGSSTVPNTLRERVKRNLDLKINLLTTKKINYRDTIITNVDTLVSRQMMVKEGRDMPEYNRYRTKIPRNERDKNKDPHTPDIYEKCSDHSWKDQIIKWRTDLKVFDSMKPPEKEKTKSSEPRSSSQSKTTSHLSWCSSCKCKVDVQLFKQHLHSDQHKKSRPVLFCVKCKLTDHDVHNFQQHLTSKRHKMPYVGDITCPVCNQTFRYMKQYIKHNDSEYHKRKMKHTVSVFACTGCSFKGVDLDELDKHIQNNKEVTNPQNVTLNCTNCNIKCSDAKEYKKHLESKAHNEKLAGEKETVSKRPKLMEEKEAVSKRPKLVGEKETVSKRPKLTEEKEAVSKRPKLVGEKETVSKRPKLTEEKEAMSKRPKLMEEKEAVPKRPKLAGEKSTPFDLACNLCSFKSKNAKEFEKHQRSSHHTKRAVQDIRSVQLDCHKCAIKFTSLEDYEKHMLSPGHIQKVKGKLHMSTTDKQFKTSSVKCIQCQELFQNKDAYTAHIDSKYHHFVTKTVAKKQILDECTVCNIRFQDLKSFGEHLQDGEHIFIMSLSGTGGIKCVICQWKPSSECSVTAACNAYVKHLKDIEHVQHIVHLHRVFGSSQNVFVTDQPKYCNSCKNQFKCDAEFHQCANANQIDPERLCSILVATVETGATSSRSTNALKFCLRQFGEIINLKVDDNLTSITFKTICSTNDVMDIMLLGGLNVLGKRLNIKRLFPKQITAADNTIILTNFPNIRGSQLYSHFSKYGKIQMYNFDSANECSPNRFGCVIFESVRSALNAYLGGDLADGRSTHAILFESVTCYFPYKKSSFKVLLKGLSSDITTEHLQKYLSSYGKIEAMQVYKDVYTPGSEMYGIVTFDSAKAVNLVVKEKTKHSIMGKPFECLSHEQAVEKNTVVDEWFEGNLGEEDDLKMEDSVMDMLPPGIDEPILTPSCTQTLFIEKSEEKKHDVASSENDFLKDKPAGSKDETACAKEETACAKEETACAKDDSASPKDNSVNKKSGDHFFIAGKNLSRQMLMDYFGSFGVVTRAHVMSGKSYGSFNLLEMSQQDQLKLLGTHHIQGLNYDVKRSAPKKKRHEMNLISGRESSLERNKDSMSKDDKQLSTKTIPKVTTPNKTDTIAPQGSEQETPKINVTEQPVVKNDQTPVPLSTESLVSYPSVCITGRAPVSYCSGVKVTAQSSVSEVRRKDSPLVVRGILNDSQSQGSMSKDDEQSSTKTIPKVAIPNKTDTIVPPGTEQETPIINVTEQPGVKNDQTPVPLSTKSLVSYPSVCITGRAPVSYCSGVKETAQSSVSEVERKGGPLVVRGILNDNQSQDTESVELTTFVLYGLSALTKEGHLWQYFTKKGIGKVQSVFVARSKSMGSIRFTDVRRAEILKLTGETHLIMGGMVTCVQKLAESSSKRQPVEPKLADDFAELIPDILQKRPNWKGNSRGIEYVIAGLLCNVCGWFYKLEIPGQHPSKARAQHIAQIHFKQPTEESDTTACGIEGVFCKVCNEFVKSKDRERALDTANDHCTLLKHHLNVKLNKLQNNRPLPKWLKTPLYSDGIKRVFTEQPPKPQNKPPFSNKVGIPGLVHYGSSDEEDLPKDKEKRPIGSSLQDGNDEDGDADETDMVGSEWFVSELYDSDEEAVI